MTSSARSLLLVMSSRRERSSATGSVKRGRVPLMGRVRIMLPLIFRNDSGDDDMTVRPSSERYAACGAGLASRSRV